MDFIKAELTGVYGNTVLQEMNEILTYYNAYDGNLSVEADVETGDYEPSIKKVNYIKKLIKEEARFLLGVTPDISVISDDEEAQKYLDDVLEANLFPDKLVKAGRDAMIGKRIALKLNLVGQGDKQRVGITFAPSLEFVYEPSIYDESELDKIIFFYTVKEHEEKKEQRIWRQKYEMLDGKCYLSEGIYDGEGNEVDITHDMDDTGLSFIPCYVLLNDGLSGDTGESDVADLMNIQENINKMSSQDLDALLKGMNEIIYGIDVDNNAIQHFKNKPGAFWDIVTDPTKRENQAVIGLLSKNFNYDTRIENVLNRMKSEMHELLSIPEIDSSSLQGSLTSAKAMRALYWSLMNRSEEKWTQWGAMLKWMARAILEISEVYNLYHLGAEYTIEVQNNYPIPDDTLDEIQADLQQVNSDAMSRVSFFKKWRNNNDEEAIAELKQIAYEKKLLEEMYSVDFDNDNDDEL